ncbi:hypothetical protein ACNJYA_08050 [Bradyrhizobium sp. DASA03068]|uniref:hypothetical protein n=1 Tax=Bradyrhizobium sp. BLXBL-01 TaxID=3395915 RepID=UPI003F6E9469
MNVDPGNATDTPFEAHNSLQEPRWVHGPQDELNAQISAPAHGSDGQESFEQHLNDLNLDDVDSLYPASASLPLAANSAIAKSSSAPGVEASQIDRCPAPSFVGARAQLAATLMGATLQELKNEIVLAEKQSARWAPAGDNGVDRDRIYDNIADSTYLTLRRFQNQDSDCKPRTEATTSAILHVRNTARDHSSIGHPLERHPLDLARQAGWHMRGKTASPFVSLVEEPSKLSVSRDHWARAIANDADTLHTYVVPKFAVWTPDDVLSSIGLGMNVEDNDNIDADVDLMCSLGRAPTRETERLFLGGNLERYRVASEDNPFKRKTGE